jgi:hypothetical protein
LTARPHAPRKGHSWDFWHLRFSDQWPDLYGADWVESLLHLYRDRTWSFADAQRSDGFSVVLFGAHGVHYTHPPREAVDELRACPGISSIQIAFHENRPASTHSMPPGGFRLAVVNSADLAIGRAARIRLAQLFGLDSAEPAHKSRAAIRSAGKTKRSLGLSRCDRSQCSSIARVELDQE